MKKWNNFRKIKKLQKAKRCVTCNRKIDIGEGCFNYVGGFEGIFQNWYICPVCHEFFEIITEWGEWLTGDEMYEFVAGRINRQNYDDIDIDTKNNVLILTDHSGKEEKFDLIKWIKDSQQ